MDTNKEIKDLWNRSHGHCKSAVVVDRWHFWDKKMIPDVALDEWGFGINICWMAYYRGLDIKILCFNIYIGIWK